MSLSRLIVSLCAFCAMSGCIIVPIPVSVAENSPLAVRMTGSTANSAAMPAKARARVTAMPNPVCARPAVASGYEHAILSAINAERTKAGLRPLAASPRLSVIAHNHACDNLARQTISHVSTDGRELAARMSGGGYRGALMAENTGLGFVDSPARMMQFWMNSPPHRSNILQPKATEAGLGYASAAGGKPAWVLNIGRPK